MVDHNAISFLYSIVIINNTQMLVTVSTVYTNFTTYDFILLIPNQRMLVCDREHKHEHNSEALTVKCKVYNSKCEELTVNGNIPLLN